MSENNPTTVLNEIAEALESRGYANMANGRDIGLILDSMPKKGLPPDSPSEMLDSIKKLMDQVESLKDTLAAVMAQSESDLKSAHAEICKLQGLDPAAHTWPAWTPQANSIRWFASLREKYGLVSETQG